jgi:hypothetical protein
MVARRLELDENIQCQWFGNHGVTGLFRPGQHVRQCAGPQHSRPVLHCTVLHTPKSLPSEICKYSITVFKQKLKLLLKMKRKRKERN